MNTVAQVRITADDHTFLEAALTSDKGHLVDHTPYPDGVQQYVEVMIDDLCLSIVMRHDSEGITIEVISLIDQQATA